MRLQTLLFSCLLALAWWGGSAAPALALQDDVFVNRRSPAALFRDDTQPVDGLTAFQGAISLAVYPVNDTHRWHGRVMGDVALLTVGQRFVLSGGLSAETVADHRNNIAFRLIRFYYEASLAGHGKLGPGVLTAAYRHRCSHGADDAVEGRILIRSGLSLDYTARFVWGDVSLQWMAGLDVTVVGQNADTNYQPRFLLQTTLLLEWAFHKRLALLVEAGVGMFLAGSAAEGVNWHIASPLGNVQVQGAPAAAVGLAVLARVQLQVLAHYQRIVDTGLGNTRTSADLFSIRVVLQW